MVSTNRGELLLFVKSEPGPGEAPYQPVGMFARMVLPLRSLLDLEDQDAQKPSSNEEHPWHLPREMIACVNVALDIARRIGRGVILVDVNRPGEQQELVNRYAATDQVFPLLVRPDGGRLQGPADFVPGRLRRFIKDG